MIWDLQNIKGHLNSTSVTSLFGCRPSGQTFEVLAMQKSKLDFFMAEISVIV